jgi:5-methyltetrahydropteroyltriglutamate--homocysteine methyltransferase
VLWSPWQLHGVLADGKRDALRAVVHEQERRGVDIVTDGEQTVSTSSRPSSSTSTASTSTTRDRAHPQPIRRERADGGRRGRRRASVFVEDAAFLRGQTDRPSSGLCRDR